MNLSLAILLQGISFLLFFQGLWAQESQPFEVIPFEMVGEHIFVKAIVEDADTLDLVFDTGASTLVLNQELVKRKNWNFNQIATSTGVGGSTTLNLGQINSLSLGKIRIERIQGVSAPLSHLELRIGKDIDGIIGFEILDRFIVSIDYQDEELRLFKSKQKESKRWGNGVDIDLALGIPSISAHIFLPDGQKIKGRYFIDSGAGSALILTSPLVRKYQIESKVSYGYLDQANGLSNSAATIIETEIPELNFCGFSINYVPTRLSKSQQGVMAMKDYAGIIGNPVLKRFTLTFDYGRSKMYVQPEENYEQPFIQNTSGLKIRLSPEKTQILVDQVIDGSPADKAGIQISDVLSTVNGMVVRAEDIHEIRKQLTGIDEKIQIELTRGKKSLHADLWLEVWYK